MYDENTKMEQLREIAKSLGTTDEDLKPLKSKDQVKALIDELAAKTEETGDDNDNVEGEVETGDGEAAPSFDGVDGVA